MTADTQVDLYEPGRFASWITPPNVGINDRSIDFPYVRLG